MFPLHLQKLKVAKDTKCTLTGTIHRGFQLSPNKNILRLTIIEFKTCGYSPVDFFNALMHMTKYNDSNNTWTDIVNWFVEKIRIDKEANEKEDKKIQKNMHHVLGMHNVLPRKNETTQFTIYGRQEYQ